MARVRASPAASSSSSEEDENGIEALARSVAIEPEQITANAPAAAAARAVRRESGGDAPAGAGKVTPIMRKAQAMLEDVLSRRIRVVDADNREDDGGGRERGAGDGDAGGGGGKASDMLIFRKAKRARGQSAPGGEGNGLGLNDPRGFWQFPASTGAHLPQQKRDCNNTTTKSKKRGQKRGDGGGGSGSDSSDIEVPSMHAITYQISCG